MHLLTDATCGITDAKCDLSDVPACSHADAVKNLQRIRQPHMMRLPLPLVKYHVIGVTFPRLTALLKLTLEILALLLVAALSLAVCLVCIALMSLSRALSRPSYAASVVVGFFLGFAASS